MHKHDYGFSTELKMILDTVREFIKKEIIPVEQNLDSDATKFPDEEVARLQKMTKELGMYQPSVPEELGGAGLDFFSAHVFTICNISCQTIDRCQRPVVGIFCHLPRNSR